MNTIRRAEEKDYSRIAELMVVNYRTNFYQFFHKDEYYFGELNVVDTIKDFCERGLFSRTFVYDDGAVKGFVSINGTEVEKLFVEPQFQGQGIGAELLRFAVNEHKADFLWALEYNARGIAFYQRYGFMLTAEKIIEDEWIPLVKLVRT
ncbi:MAG: GNAT family N-acetyltransferase [Treponema sp.]|nr:GNAT family N-acetyltransferase [Treponema sp.]